MKPAALIYSHTPSPRLQYIVDFLSHYYGFPFKLTSSEEYYQAADCSCRINYSYHRLHHEEIWIHSHVLLFETAERPVKIECFLHNGHKAFFKTEGDVGFDLFAAIFYLISRYEEYLPHKKDLYGRFAHENSIAFKESFLQQPLVNTWLEDFRELLKAKNEDFASSYSDFIFLPTYDIDMAWTYRQKGWKRNLGGLLWSIIKLKWEKAIERIRVLNGKMQDPYDAYEWLDQIHNKFDLHPVYFLLVGEERNRHDKNISVHDPEFIALIKNLDAGYSVGLHPSWASGDSPALIEKEKQFLENLVQKHIESSRQHFLRFELPATYRQLLHAGIINEYSMGYGTINGFRASIATSYYWYDLREEAPTTLMIHPFCFMDANAFYEEKLSLQKALDQLMLKSLKK
jgi:hypothetical protein